ncbi:interferon phi 1 [Salarias fasciatus]|uniref:interferon phi 1 n=1 Tax=Salarias fasciatus TaxID=181472 RepID=UPI001176998D|nr:interferon a3-like [Salarias fasciatus]
MVSWNVVLLVVCGLPATVLGCDWLQRYGRLNNDSLTLLKRMGKNITNREPPVHFPYPLYQHIRHAKDEIQLVFIRETLELILDLYHHDNLSSAGWDAVMSEHFQISIHRQIEELGRCVETKHSTNRKLRRYFGKLKRRTLGSSGGSKESWELLWKQTKEHLCQLELLVNHMT